MTAARRPSRLGLALGLTAALTVFEFAGGIVAHSLALLSDAAHVSMDVVALGLALAAQRHAARPATARQTFGFARVEVLAALGNGGLLFGITVLIVVEAIRRFGAPVEPAGPLMFAVAGIGLVVEPRGRPHDRARRAQRSQREGRALPRRRRRDRRVRRRCWAASRSS